MDRRRTTNDGGRQTADGERSGIRPSSFVLGRVPVTRFPMIDETNAIINLTARWIAPPGDKPDNYTFLARREFVVDAVPERAVLRVAADSRYVVYLNGQRVGQGPARGTDKRYFFDSYDVAPCLCKGKNRVAARVHCPVKPLTSAVPPVTPALFVQIAGLVKSDASWQVRADPSYRADAPLYTHHIGYSEYRDLRKEAAGWQTFADDATDWTQAAEVAKGPKLGGRILSPRDIPALTDERYRPAEVIDAGGVPAHSEKIEADVAYADLMQMETHLHTAQPRFENAEALTWGGPVRVLPSARLTPQARGEGAYLILDFGRELCGNFILDIESPEGTIVDVGYDEAVVNGRLDTRRVNPNGSVYRFADRYILRAGRQRIESRLHDRGLRAVQLVLRRFSRPVRIHSVEVANQIYPIPIEASFECDQEFLNRLWDMCCATMSACSLDLFVDCPWREQTLWLDDHYQENLFYFTMSSDRAFPARNLRVSAEGALPNGMIPARYPSMRKCLLPCTSANWAEVLSDYYIYTGDIGLVRELLPVVDKALRVYAAWQDEDGLVPDQEDPGMWNFIDWGYDISGVQLGGKTAALNMLIAAAFKRAAALHEVVGDAGRAEEFRRKSREFVTAIHRRFWMAAERRLYDCTDPKDGRRTFSQIPHALGVYFGLFDAEQRDAALDVLLDPGAVRAEYGYQLFVLEALARHGRAAQALRIIHERWGHMVEADSPTLWEVADGRSSMTGCGSLCHGFSCAPMYFMQTTLLGVRPLKPGFEEFSLAPQSLGVLWAQGHVPTPHGRIHVAWSAHEDGSLLADVEVPEGTTALLSDGRRFGAGEHRVKIKTGG